VWQLSPNDYSLCVVIAAMAGRAQHWRRVRQLALLLVVLAVGHEAIYLARFGVAGAVPSDAGHAYWPTLLLFAGAAVVLLIARGRWRLTRGVETAVTGPELPTTYRAEWIRIFGALAPAAAALYLVVENVEHLIGHGHAEGIGIYLAPESILSLPIVLLTSALAATVGAIVRWREIVLIGRLRQVRRRRTLPAPQTAASRWHITAALIHRMFLAARSAPDRAPPLALTA
jgi:hypothetical protein